jgi:hypothetical protein
MHGSPWLRASEATRVRRRQINGLERLGRAIGVLIGVLEFALGKIGVLEFAAIGIAQPSWASIGANGQMMHDFPHYPIEVLTLATYMDVKGLELFAMLNEVGLAVMDATNNSQQPWISFSPIPRKIILNPIPTTPPALA